MWLALVKAVMGFGGGIVSKFQDRKQKSDDARVAWETVAGRSMIDSWKDEYLTVVVTWPLVGIPIAAIAAVYSDQGVALMKAMQDAMMQIGLLLDTPYGDILYIVVLAGVGIKVSQKFIK